MEDDEAICVFPHRLDDSVQSMVFVVSHSPSTADDTRSLVDCTNKQLYFSVYGQGEKNAYVFGYLF